MRQSWLFPLLLLFSLGTDAGPLDEGLRAFQSKNYAQALSLWRPLAEQGDARAQYNLGLLYANGWGVERSARAALDWYRKAARQGQADAQYNLGLMYARGEGVFRSEREAVMWWQQAAAQGHPEASYNLGVMLAYGRGVGKDVERALRLWRQAAASGHKRARQALVRTWRDGLLGLEPDPEKAARWGGKNP